MILLNSPSTARKSKSLRTTRTAFTLLEVLVVVAIIVMLAGVGGYYLLSQYEASKVSRAKIDCKGLADQADIYKLNNDQPAASIEALTQAQPNGGDPLVPAEKIRDPWGKTYQLDSSGLKSKVYTTTPKGVTVSNLDTK